MLPFSLLSHLPVYYKASFRFLVYERREDHFKPKLTIEFLPCHGLSRTTRMKIRLQNQTKLTLDYTMRKPLSQQINLTMAINHYGYSKNPIPRRALHPRSLHRVHRGLLKLLKRFPRRVVALLHLMTLVRWTRKLSEEFRVFNS